MRRVMVIMIMLLATGTVSVGASNGWILWSRWFYVSNGLVQETSHQPSAAFDTREACLGEQRRRHQAYLAKQCRNIWTNKLVDPHCRSVSAIDETGVAYHYRGGEQLQVFDLCWPVGLDPRR
jgi:hypothetical protein